MPKFEFSDQDRVITVYGYHPVTLEYIGKSDCQIPSHTGLPAYATDERPPLKGEGEAVVFDVIEDTWKLVPDHRGKVVYSTETGLALGIITMPGDIKEKQTLVEPATQWDKWVNGEWVTDNAERLAHVYADNARKKARIIAETSEEIEILTDRINLNMSDDSKADRELIEKLTYYRVAIYSLKVDTEVVDWPVKPSAVPKV